MGKTLSTILIVLAILVLAGGLFFFGTVYGRALAFGPARLSAYGWNNSAYGRGMMAGHGSHGMMGGPRGYGMMGSYGNNFTANVPPLTVDQAKAAAARYLAALNNPDLAIAEVTVFSNNAYVAVKETSTGRGAFELLVDPASQVVYPEHGPNMMWNLKYGGLNHQYMMGGRGYGMMPGWNYQYRVPANVSANMPVTPEQAIQDAQAYLDANIAGATAANDPMQFYGYYTLDFSKGGKIAGMLSVNGYSGQIFLHTWHGAFVEEAK